MKSKKGDSGSGRLFFVAGTIKGGSIPATLHTHKTPPRLTSTQVDIHV